MPKLVPFAAVKPHAWPSDLRRLHILRQAALGPFTKPNVAATWRPTTFKLHEWSVSYFVGWLQWSGRLTEGAELRDYVTSDIIAAYVDETRTAGLSPKSIATRVDGVRAALAALAPEVPAAWLMRGINKLRAEPSDRRQTQARTQHTARIVELGLDLMNQAVEETAVRTAHERAVLYRDGLIIVFMALAVPRLDTVSMMMLGQHLTRHQDGYRIAWSRREMKEDRPHEARLGTELSGLIQRYLDEFRPVLAAKSKHPTADAKNAVLLNKRGQPLRSRGIYDLIVARTGVAFGTPMFPHAFRHSAATTLVLERPDLIKLITPLLQHRDISSREYYILSDRMEAARRYGEALTERRARRCRPPRCRIQPSGGRKSMGDQDVL